VYGGRAQFQSDPHGRALILCYAYLHGDTGAGASHQTGWTGAVAFMIPMLGLLAGDRAVRLRAQETAQAAQAAQAARAEQKAAHPGS
jgi:hypothetical protein